MIWLLLALAALVLLLCGVAAHDLTQRQHAILRNFPVIGHLRFLLEAVGPELRQYIVTDNDSERPFSRDQRRWVYSSAKQENTFFGFGSDNDFEHPQAGYVLVKHSAFPHPPVAADHDPNHPLPMGKVLGASHGRRLSITAPSIVNISGMSFGALSGAAVTAMNEGAKLACCWQTTGEGGLSPYHQRGGDLVFQIGTSYFGVRDGNGRFELSRLIDLCAANPIRAIEIKLSQGAKPGLGGLLPGAKVTAEIARIRSIPIGVDCHSPGYHREFSSVESLVEFVERIADATGLPVGIKSAVGEQTFWESLTAHMAATGTGVDFVTIDGGEGGTGAAPLTFSDHVALPFRIGFPRVYGEFASAGLQHDVVFIGSGKLGFPEAALLALGMGCDAVNVGREAMLAVGCIQAQRCHTGRCPTGVATQSARLARGLDPTLKSVRCAQYVASLRKELLDLAHACGQPHPSLVGLGSVELLRPDGTSSPAIDSTHYSDPSWGELSGSQRDALRAVMEALSPQEAGFGTG